MSESIRRRILYGILLPLPLMAIVCLVLWSQAGRWREETRWVEHSREVLAEAHLGQRLLLDQETGLRGYLLTRERTFLEPWESGVKQFPSVLDRLFNLASDNAAQQTRVSALRDQHAKWQAAAEHEISAPETGAAIVSAALERKSMMDKMRAVFQEVLDAENQLLKERRADAQTAWRSLLGWTLGVIGITGLLLVWLIQRLVTGIDGVYQTALRDRELSLTKERQARSAAEAMAEEITERSREMELMFKSVRTERDDALRRLSDLEAHS